MKVFDCNALQVKKRLGQGAFGDVFTTEFAGTEGNVETVVVKKMLHVLDESEKKLFFKEAALLNGLHHKIQEIEIFDRVRIAPYMNHACIGIKKTFINMINGHKFRALTERLQFQQIYLDRVVS